MFAAQKIAQAGHEVIILNRDIKPGGLAEYGIYPTKDKMKTGLRKQFAKVLSLPNVHYIGHVAVANASPVTIADLREFSPSAIVFSVGAQGTKKLGLPGDNCGGVYCAKDFVYYYNQLPPFASQDFSVGRRIAIVGMGNVMVDLAHWLLIDDPKHTAEEVIVIARRGPFEAKFDLKEFVYVERFLDRQAFQEELKRIQPQLAAVGQDIAKVAEDTFPILAKPQTPASGRINRLTITENVLVERDGNIGCKGTEKTVDIDVDTMIFAIGDVADPTLGLPYNKDCYVTCSDVADPNRPIYEVLDPPSGKAMDGIYVVGWARKASEGLVGIARHDGEVGAAGVLNYLETSPEKPSASYEQVRKHLVSKGLRIVEKPDLEYLARAEEKQAKERGLAWFKFSDDESMLTAIEQEKSRAVSVVVGS
ncbi:MAG: hypothetical protein DMG67_00740 [Acidobacteria bacterium]|nr:MAG: hypothetical protein DMG67_00740 [Acidobacteriota bacterium]